MLDEVPSEFIAGDTWAWTRDLDDYPAPTWVATVYFGDAAGTFSSVATASGDHHAFSIPAATTAGKKAGRYHWSVRVTDGASVITAESGWVNVRVNPAADGISDARSDARKMLDALNAFLIGKASNAQLSVTINGRSLTTYSLSDLIEWQQTLEARVRTEEGGGVQGGRRTIKLRYTRA